VGELDAGAAAVAAPILDRRGRLVAGLSVAGPRDRITVHVPALRAAVTAAAGKVQRAYES
jgi:DNA-binding IclR family transcriptional regulator